MASKSTLVDSLIKSLSGGRVRCRDLNISAPGSTKKKRGNAPRNVTNLKFKKLTPAEKIAKEIGKVLDTKGITKQLKDIGENTAKKIVSKATASTSTPNPRAMSNWRKVQKAFFGEPSRKSVDESDDEIEEKEPTAVRNWKKIAHLRKQGSDYVEAVKQFQSDQDDPEKTPKKTPRRPKYVETSMKIPSRTPTRIPKETPGRASPAERQQMREMMNKSSKKITGRDSPPITRQIARNLADTFADNITKKDMFKYKVHNVLTGVNLGSEGSGMIIHPPTTTKKYRQ
jgi:hypothetical protein